MDYVAIGELAGLGAIGYHGLLITPDAGARVRISTIYTNIDTFPVETENPTYGSEIFARTVENVFEVTQFNQHRTKSE